MYNTTHMLFCSLLWTDKGWGWTPSSWKCVWDVEGERRTSCSSRRHHVRGSRQVFGGQPLQKFSQEVMWSLLWFSLLLIPTFLVLCPPHQNGISPAPLFRGLKPDRFVKRPWIESFGAVSQKSTCRAGVKRQLPIIPTRCQASFKGWRLKIKHIEASRLDHSQKIKHIKASRLDHSQKIKHFEISPEGHSRASLTLILNTI